MATTITIDDRTIRINETRDASPQQALERTLARLYGARTFMQPCNQEKWQNAGQSFRGYVDLYRPNRDRLSASLVAEHVWIAVNA